MKTRNKKKNMQLQKLVEESVNNAFTSGFKSVLHDIEYRIGVMIEKGVGGVGRITSDMLNIAKHVPEGYVVTPNSPIAGSIAWTGLSIQYKGVTYALTDGSTALKYAYWTLGTTPNALRFSATKPALTVDDIVVFVNENGTPTLVMEGFATGSMLKDGSISSGEIGNGAVLSAAIGAGAVGSGNLAAGAVIAGKIATDAVVAANIASNAVTADKMAAGSVTATKLNLAQHFIS